MATARPHRCGVVDGDSFADDLEQLVARARAHRTAAALEPTPPRLDLRRVDRCTSCGSWQYDQQCTTCDETSGHSTTDRRTLYDDRAVS